MGDNYDIGYISRGDRTRILYAAETKINIVLPTSVKKVIFNGPATIVYWNDDSKTVVKCMEGDGYDPEKGLAMAIAKKYLGGDFKSVFKKWMPEEDEKESKRWVR